MISYPLQYVELVSNAAADVARSHCNLITKCARVTELEREISVAIKERDTSQKEHNQRTCKLSDLLQARPEEAVEAYKKETGKYPLGG